MRLIGDDPARQPGKATRTLRLSLAVGFLGLGVTGVLAFSWLKAEPPPLQSGRAPDGARIDLLGWTFDSHHEFVAGPRWLTLLWPHVQPVQRSTWNVSHYYRLRAPDRSLVLWAERTPPSTAFRLGRQVTIDEHGCKLSAEDRSTYGVSGTGSRILEPWALDQFPRRGGTFRVRHYAPDAQMRPVPALEVTIPNPDPGPHPEWQPEPLPANKSLEGFTFTLAALQTRRRESWKKGPLSPGEEVWSRATFRLARPGKGTRGWYASEVVVWDATGNRWRPWQHASEHSGEELRFDFPVGLCVHEAYRLRVEFTHQQEAGPEDLIRLSGLPVPGPGGTILLGRTYTRREVSVTLQSVLGRRTRIEELGGEQYDVPLLAVTVGPEPLGQNRLRLFPDPGEAVGRISTSAGQYWFPLHPRPNSGRAELTLAVRKSLFVEFIARPTVPGDEAPRR
jgi:hypothetical protein